MKAPHLKCLPFSGGCRPELKNDSYLLVGLKVHVEHCLVMILSVWNRQNYEHHLLSPAVLELIVHQGKYPHL